MVEDRWLPVDEIALCLGVKRDAPCTNVDRPQADACPQGGAPLEIFEKTRSINGFDASVAGTVTSAGWELERSRAFGCSANGADRSTLLLEPVALAIQMNYES